MTGVRRARGSAGLLAFVLTAAVVAGCDDLPGLGGASSEPTRPVAPIGTLSPAGTGGPSGTTEPVSGLPVVALADLPPEAAATVALIDAGGPFPYAQDGSVFQNREGLLPPRPSGYYREYTVPTPGSDDRGARRIVAGTDGEMFWTADHYDSFAWIDR